MKVFLCYFSFQGLFFHEHNVSAKTQAKIPKQMRTFEDSLKSKKTVASMIERKGEEKSKKSG